MTYRSSEAVPPAAFDGCLCLGRTRKSALIHIPDYGDSVWVPLGKIHPESEVSLTGNQGLLLLDWTWARKQGLA